MNDLSTHTHGSAGGRRTTTRLWLLINVFLILGLSGCDTLLGLPFQQEAQQNATVTPDIPQEQVTETVQQTPVEVTPTQVSEDNNQLTIWVPPLMDPNAGTGEGELLKEYLARFSEQHPDVVINVRVKARSGQAGLLDSLVSTSTAAPLALPSLILLPRRDMEQAAKRGLILSMSDYSTVINELDWFQYARTMSAIGDSSFGLPFSGNTLVMVYRPEAFEEGFPKKWAELFELGQAVYFPAANPTAAFPMALYASLGGDFTDENGKPALDLEVFQQMLSILDEGSQTGIFPASLYEYQDPAVIWNEYLLGHTNIVVTWTNYYLGDLPADSEVIPLIPVTDYNYTLAEGWFITLSDPLPERRALAVELAEYLVDVRFNADWNQAAGYLPMRSGSLELWENQNLVDTMELVSYSAHPFPAQEINDVIAPIIVDAVSQVLTQGVEPEVAADKAVNQLLNIEE